MLLLACAEAAAHASQGALFTAAKCFKFQVVFDFSSLQSTLGSLLCDFKIRSMHFTD